METSTVSTIHSNPDLESVWRADFDGTSVDDGHLTMHDISGQQHCRVAERRTLLILQRCGGVRGGQPTGLRGKRRHQAVVLVLDRVRLLRGLRLGLHEPHYTLVLRQDKFLPQTIHPVMYKLCTQNGS